MKIRGFTFLFPSIIISAIFIFLYCLESFNYDNYVYANLHFNLARFSVIPGIFWAAWAYYYLTKKKSALITKILAIVFCLVSVPSGIQSVGSIFARTVLAFKGKDYIVQKSMQKMYGDDYKFMNFVKSYLQENNGNALVLPPNTVPWRHTGNPQIMNSYLYPITTTNATDNATPYMLISSETESVPYHLWPDFKVPASEIIIFNWEKEKPTIIKDRDWDPNEWQDEKPWGLIITKQ